MMEKPTSKRKRVSRGLRKILKMARRKQTVPREIPPPTPYVPQHAASSFMKTATPVHLSERHEPGGLLRDYPTAPSQQPTQTLHEQAEEMRERGRQRVSIFVGAPHTPRRSASPQKAESALASPPPQEAPPANLVSAISPEVVKVAEPETIAPETAPPSTPEKPQLPDVPQHSPTPMAQQSSPASAQQDTSSSRMRDSGFVDGPSIPVNEDEADQLNAINEGDSGMRKRKSWRKRWSERRSLRLSSSASAMVAAV